MAASANWTRYKSRPPILDVTVTALAAGTTDFACPISGSITGTSAAQVTDTNLRSTVANGTVREGLLVTVTPIIQDASTIPDCEIWFQVNNNSLRGYQVFDVGANVNMLPSFNRVQFDPEIEMPLLLLGRSTRDVLRESAASVAAGGPPIPNLPTLITGYKVTDQLVLHVASKAGWSSPYIPLRVRVYGEVLTQNEVAELAALGYPGSIAWDIPPTTPFATTHTWAGLGTISGWNAGPGGDGQGAVKVNRRIAYAYNAEEADGGYVFSNQNGVNGDAGQVGGAAGVETDTSHDLGEVLENSNNAVFIDRVGFNLYHSGDQAYVAWQINGGNVPAETPNGKLVSYSGGALSYGQDAHTGNVQTLRNVDNLARVLMYKNNIAPIMTPTTKTSTIGANNASFALAGTIVEQ